MTLVWKTIGQQENYSKPAACGLKKVKYKVFIHYLLHIFHNFAKINSIMGCYASHEIKT